MRRSLSFHKDSQHLRHLLEEGELHGRPGRSPGRFLLALGGFTRATVSQGRLRARRLRVHVWSGKSPGKVPLEPEGPRLMPPEVWLARTLPWQCLGQAEGAPGACGGLVTPGDVVCASPGVRPGC